MNDSITEIALGVLVMLLLFRPPRAERTLPKEEEEEEEKEAPKAPPVVIPRPTIRTVCPPICRIPPAAP